MLEEVSIASITKEQQKTIDSRAIIDPSAVIHPNVTIGPWSIIGPNVEIGEGCEIHSHVIIERNAKIGRNNQIYPFAVLGGDPQDLAYRQENTCLEIGDDNTIREYVTISRGSAGGEGVTRIGNKNFILAYCHIAHDCQIGNEILFTNNATLAGHVTVDDYAILGAFTAIHQYCRIGSYAFITRAAKVNRDVLPYVYVTGQIGETHGLNLIGLQRRGFSEDTIRQLKKAYNIIFRRGLKLNEVETELEKLTKVTPEIEPILELIQNSDRGFIR